MIQFSRNRSIRWPQILAAGLLLPAWPGHSSGLFAFAGAAQRVLASQDEAMNFSLEGKITKLEANKFTVTTGENILFHVRYNAKSDIKKEDGSSASAKDFRVKMNVKVEGDLTETGEIVARKIEIQQDAGSKSPPPR